MHGDILLLYRPWHFLYLSCMLTFLQDTDKNRSHVFILGIRTGSEIYLQYRSSVSSGSEIYLCIDHLKVQV